MDPDTEIWSIWVNSSETTAYTARDNEVIVADISPKVTATLLPGSHLGFRANLRQKILQKKKNVCIVSILFKGFANSEHKRLTVKTTPE